MTVKQPLSLAFMGDVRVPERTTRAGKAVGVGADPFAEVNEWLSGADLVIANLEGPIGGGGTVRPGRGALLFNDSRVLDLMAPWKKTLLVLANNHLMDFGPEGLARTLETLELRNIPYVGAGMDEAAAQRPCILNLRGRSVAFLAFTTEERHVGSVCAHGQTPGCAEFRPAEAVEAVRALARSVDVVCVILHWGHERHAYPTPAQVAGISDLVQAGARLVVGHHPHVLQGMHAVGEALVAYSLGNCYFPPFEQTNGRMSLQSAEEREFLLLKAHVDERGGIQPEILGGSCGPDERLHPFVGSDRLEFESRFQRLAEPLHRGGYDGFYAAYARVRAVELERQGLWHSLRKVRMQDLQSIRMDDIQRLWKRLTAMRRR